MEQLSRHEMRRQLALQARSESSFIPDRIPDALCGQAANPEPMG
jgi:hypothetical protein